MKLPIPGAVRVAGWLVAAALLVGCTSKRYSLQQANNNNTNNNNNNTTGICGDAVIQASEQCDGTQLGGADCIGQGFAGGTLGCGAGCRFDTTGCTGGALCGNGGVDAGEECDGGDLSGQSCRGLGFASGTLACTGQCRFDTTGCVLPPLCGNGLIDAGEECDGADLNGGTCQGEGFVGGTLGCTASCTYDTSQCTSGGARVVINEISIDAPDWVELYNAGNAPVDLAGWELQWWGYDGNLNLAPGRQTLPAFTLGPGEFVVVQDDINGGGGAAYVSNGRIVLDVNVPWDTDPAAVMLSSTTAPVDFVRFGGDDFAVPGGATFDDSAGMLPTLHGGSTNTLARVADGADADVAADFCVQAQTPGAANGACRQPAVSPGAVIITEIDVGDTSGTSFRADHIELYNPGASPIDLGGFILRWSSSSVNGTPTGYTVLPAYTLDAGQRVLLIDNAPGTGPWVDFQGIHIFNVNWSETLSGACWLQEPTAYAGVDFVRWGPDTDALPFAADAWDDSAGRLPLIPGTTDVTLGRASLTDTNAAADWCLMNISLDAPNNACN